MKWLVLWTLISMNPVPCQQATPVPDSYGRAPQYTSMVSLACWDVSRKSMSREFASFEDAKKFVDEGMESCKDKTMLFLGDCDLQDFRVEEIR